MRPRIFERVSRGVLVAVALGVGAATAYVLSGGRIEGNTRADAKTLPASAAVKDDTVSVGSDQMHQLDIAKVDLSSFLPTKAAIGQIAFNEDASTTVLTPYSGRVTRLFARVGDEVKRGDPMFEIDSPEVVQAQTDLMAASQALEKIKSQLHFSKRTLERQSSLYADKATSLRELEQARTDHAAAEADVRTAEAAVTAARNRLRVLVGRTAAEVERVERDRSIDPLVTVNAPIDGTVISRKVGPGQFVRSDSGEPLFAIADLSVMWLKANVPESDIPHIRVGQAIEVKVTAVPDRTFNARITAIGAASDSATRRVMVRSEIPNPDGRLKAEMFATFKIFLDQGEPSLSVPTNAVIWEGNRPVVWVERKPLAFERRPITVGSEQSGRTQVLAGLKHGEMVVARGAIFLDNEWRK